MAIKSASEDFIEMMRSAPSFIGMFEVKINTGKAALPKRLCKRLSEFNGMYNYKGHNVVVLEQPAYSFFTSLSSMIRKGSHLDKNIFHRTKIFGSNELLKIVPMPLYKALEDVLIENELTEELATLMSPYATDIPLDRSTKLYLPKYGGVWGDSSYACFLGAAKTIDVVTKEYINNIIRQFESQATL